MRPEPASPPLATRRRSRRRLDVAVLGLASVVGLWFGLGAPSTSPVAPSPTPAVVVAPPAATGAVVPPPDRIDRAGRGGRAGGGRR